MTSFRRSTALCATLTVFEPDCLLTESMMHSSPSTFAMVERSFGCMATSAIWLRRTVPPVGSEISAFLTSFSDEYSPSVRTLSVCEPLSRSPPGMAMLSAPSCCATEVMVRL